MGGGGSLLSASRGQGDVSFGFPGIRGELSERVDGVDAHPDSSDKLAEEIDLHLDARNVLFLLGDSKAVAEHLQAAEPLAERLGDEQRLARVLNFLNSYYGLAGDPERAIEIGKRALKLGVIQADPASSIVTYYYLGAAYNKTGQYDLAIEVLTARRQEYRRRSTPRTLRHRRGALGDLPQSFGSMFGCHGSLLRRCVFRRRRSAHR